MPLAKTPRFAAIAPDVVFGKGVIVNEFVNLYGCRIGDRSMIGPFVEVQKGAAVGAHCRIQSHSFICSGVTLEDYVFIGHHVCFINDRHPDVRTAEAGTWKLEPILVRSGASIGSGALILGGVTIGSNAVIGSGAVVTKDVPDGAVMVGVPARIRQPKKKSK
jgi:UDP-2-acetamido-3-amino-2,3-dideoxy-glucuronate N-acetyltransferase